MPRVLLPLAEGFEELEAVAVIDVLRRGGIEVVVAGLQEGPVKASRGTVLHPDVTLDAVMDQDFDMVVLPGGMPGVKHLQEDERVRGLLERQRSKNRCIAAICAAPSILAAYGHLEGKRATSNPKFKEQVAIGPVRYVEDAVVEDGEVITSRGPGTSILFALALVERLWGTQRRREVEAGLVFPA